MLSNVETSFLILIAALCIVVLLLCVVLAQKDRW